MSNRLPNHKILMHYPELPISGRSLRPTNLGDRLGPRKAKAPVAGASIPGSPGETCS